MKKSYIINFNLGFTIVELLIVLIIVSILTCIICPAYNQHIVKVRRAVATIVLMDIAARLETYYVRKNKYSGATIENLGVDQSKYKDNYQINLNTKDNEFTLRAIPIGAQGKNDILCQTLLLEQDGRKSVSGNGTIQDCWP